MGYKSYSYEEYLRAMELLDMGFGLTETCRILGWPETKKTTLWWWKHGRKPPLAKWHPEPSKEFAYALGVIIGDGYIIKEHGYHYDIEILVKDYEFAEASSEALAKMLGKNVKKPYWSKSNNMWGIRYSSKAFYIWFKQQKLESLKTLIEYDKDTVANFLRGLYDSDGGHYKYVYSHGIRENICLYNDDSGLLHYTQYLLKDYFNIVATGPYINRRSGEVSTKSDGEKIKTNNNNYKIVIYRRQHIQIFLDNIGFSITEKQLGLKRRR